MDAEEKMSGASGQHATSTCVSLPVLGKERSTPIWSLVHLSLVFFFIFTAYTAAETLQTNLHAAGGLGLVSIGALYGTFFLTALLVAPVVVRQLTPKWSLFASWFFYLIFILSNYYPRWWTVILSAALLGPWCALAWVAGGVYVTQLALLEADRTDRPTSVVLARYNSIFFFAVNAVHISGNLISGFILSGGALFSSSSPGISTNASYGNLNYTYFISSLAANRSTTTEQNDRHLALCGAQYCAYKQNHVEQIIQPNPQLVNILTTVLTIVLLIGLIATAFLKNVKSDEVKKSKGCSNALSALRLMKDPRLICVLPLLGLFGLFKSFTSGSFTQAFVGCTLGVRWVGYVMFARGITCTFGCLIPGALAKYVHRTILYFVSMSLFGALAVGYLLWTPSPNEKVPFFVFAAVDGLGVGMLRVLNGAFMGQLFMNDKEAAFAHSNLWGALLTSLIYFSGKFVCVAVQVYIALGFLLLTVVGYISVEVLLIKEKKYTIKVPFTDSEERTKPSN